MAASARSRACGGSTSTALRTSSQRRRTTPAVRKRGFEARSVQMNAKGLLRRGSNNAFASRSSATVVRRTSSNSSGTSDVASRSSAYSQTPRSESRASSCRALSTSAVHSGQWLRCPVISSAFATRAGSSAYSKRVSSSGCIWFGRPRDRAEDLLCPLPALVQTYPDGAGSRIKLLGDRRSRLVVNIGTAQHIATVGSELRQHRSDRQRDGQALERRVLRGVGGVEWSEPPVVSRLPAPVRARGVARCPHQILPRVANLRRIAQIVDEDVVHQRPDVLPRHAEPAVGQGAQQRRKLELKLLEGQLLLGVTALHMHSVSRAGAFGRLLCRVER